MFAGDKGQKVPCVGVSIGIERIFSILERRAENDKNARSIETDVLVISAQKNMLKERLRILSELWDAKIKAETVYKANPKALTQFQYCEENKVPLAIIVGEGELQAGTVTIRDVAGKADVAVPRGEMVAEIRRRLALLKQ
eukprot:Opistho-2@9149